MKALGRQLLVELYHCDADRINDTQAVERAMLEATERSGATVINSEFHEFSPYGISGMVIIAESHVSIHTWPEYQYAAVDIFTCGDHIDPWIVQEALKEYFKSDTVSSMEVKRGLFKTPPGEDLPFKADPASVANERKGGYSS